MVSRVTALWGGWGMGARHTRFSKQGGRRVLHLRDDLLLHCILEEPCRRQVEGQQEEWLGLHQVFLLAGSCTGAR